MMNVSIDTIASLGEAVTYPNGGVIFLSGAVGACAYFVKAGAVEIREAGQSLEVLGSGEIFGEMALIDSGPRSASAVAVGDTTLIKLDRDAFLGLLRDNPDFVMSVMQTMARRLHAMHQTQEPAAAGLRVVPKPSRTA